MIKEYDELETKIAKVIEDDKESAMKLSKEKFELLKKMSNEEIEQLLDRPYPPQYKTKLKSYLK